MPKKYYELSEDGDYLIETKTGELYDACGGGDGIGILIDEVNKVKNENDELKQILHTILHQIEVSNIDTPNVMYSAVIRFREEEFRKICSIYKGNFDL